MIAMIPQTMVAAAGPVPAGIQSDASLIATPDGASFGDLVGPSDLSELVTVSTDPKVEGAVMVVSVAQAATVLTVCEMPQGLPPTIGMLDLTAPADPETKEARALDEAVVAATDPAAPGLMQNPPPLLPTGPAAPPPKPERDRVHPTAQTNTPPPDAGALPISQGHGVVSRTSLPNAPHVPMAEVRDLVAAPLASPPSADVAQDTVVAGDPRTVTQPTGSGPPQRADHARTGLAAQAATTPTPISAGPAASPKGAEPGPAPATRPAARLDGSGVKRPSFADPAAAPTPQARHISPGPMPTPPQPKADAPWPRPGLALVTTPDAGKIPVASTAKATIKPPSGEILAEMRATLRTASPNGNAAPAPLPEAFAVVRPIQSGPQQQSGAIASQTNGPAAPPLAAPPLADLPTFAPPRQEPASVVPQVATGMSPSDLGRSEPWRPASAVKAAAPSNALEPTLADKLGNPAVMPHVSAAASGTLVVAAVGRSPFDGRETLHRRTSVPDPRLAQARPNPADLQLQGRGGDQLAATDDLDPTPSVGLAKPEAAVTPTVRLVPSRGTVAGQILWQPKPGTAAALADLPVVKAVQVTVAPAAFIPISPEGAVAWEPLPIAVRRFVGQPPVPQSTRSRPVAPVMQPAPRTVASHVPSPTAEVPLPPVHLAQVFTPLRPGPVALPAPTVDAPNRPEPGTRPPLRKTAEDSRALQTPVPVATGWGGSPPFWPQTPVAPIAAPAPRHHDAVERQPDATSPFAAKLAQDPRLPEGAALVLQSAVVPPSTPAPDHAAPPVRHALPDLPATSLTQHAAAHGPLPHSLPPKVAGSVAEGVRRATRDEPIELLLDPVELGKVRFEMSTIGDRVQVNLSVERPETLELLRRNLDSLRSELSAAGFDASTLSFGQWGGGRDDATPAATPLIPFGDDLATTALPAQPTPSRRTAEQGLDLRL